MKELSNSDKKLALNKETLRRLNPMESSLIQGGQDGGDGGSATITTSLKETHCVTVTQA